MFFSHFMGEDSSVEMLCAAGIVFSGHGCYVQINGDSPLQLHGKCVNEALVLGLDLRHKVHWL
jgi:hypothetical protein